MRLGAGREVASGVWEFVMIVGAERLFGGAFDLLSTNMIEAFREVLQELVTSSGATCRSAHLAEAERSEVKGDKIRWGRREKRERRGGVIKTHQRV